MNNKRFQFFGLVACLFLLGGALMWKSGTPPLPEVLVYKNPNCGCCSKWADHMTKNGFTVTVREVGNMEEVRAQNHVKSTFSSCHTAVLGNYVVEGHVPADVIKQFLADAPDVRGLTVPGMPIGSPGMEQGGRVDHYDILTFDDQGQTAVYAKR
jgi:hypothetical protein